jgi:hypothetical protein
MRGGLYYNYVGALRSRRHVFDRVIIHKCLVLDLLLHNLRALDFGGGLCRGNGRQPP